MTPEELAEEYRKLEIDNAALRAENDRLRTAAADVLADQGNTIDALRAAVTENDRLRGELAAARSTPGAPTPAGEPPQFLAPLRLLFHVREWREDWSWRCRIGGSKLDPGYVDGACKYDHDVDTWEQVVADTTAHLARWHDVPAPPATEES